MNKDVLIYGGIETYTARNFINDVDNVEGDLVVRIDSNGGDPQATYGMIAKYNEFEGSKKVKIDGRAYSSAFYFAAMVENVEALSVSKVMVHRAAYPSWYEKDYMTEDEKARLKEINADLKKGFESKVDIEKFEAIAGKTVKEVFSMDDRIDVFLTAKQAKQIGLVNKVIPITASVKAELDSNKAKIAAMFTPQAKDKQVVKPKIEKMTIEKLKADHPELVSAIVAEERDRVGAYLTFIDVDAKAVSEGIKSGNPMSQTAMAEFSLKMAQANTVNAIEGNAHPPVDGQVKDPQPELTDAQKMEAEFMATLNLKNN